MNILRTSFALAALTLVALPFAGCAVQSDESRDPGPVAEAAQAVEQDLTTVAAIQADPAFNAFYQMYHETTAPFLRRGMGLSPQARSQFLSGLSGIQCSVASCPELTTYLGQNGIQIDLAKLNQVVAMEAQLRARGASTANLAHAMINFQGIQYQINPVDPGSYNQNPAYGGCLQDCELEFAYAAYVAISAYITALAACTAWTVGWPVCAGLATAAYAFALYEADQNLEACKDRCDSSCSSTGTTCGSGSGTLNDDCKYDSECAGGEHCSTLVQGLWGKCKTDFSTGHTCARNSWCTTNNCSWFFCAH